jgi:hypothetical protein
VASAALTATHTYSACGAQLTPCWNSQKNSALPIAPASRLRPNSGRAKRLRARALSSAASKDATAIAA